VLTETMEQRPELGLNSYDRLFPSQDTLPQGGFGSLIALPLQKAARGQGNSVFLDADLNPWPDQWAFLASLRRIGRERIERTVQAAERPIAGALPNAIELVRGNQIYIPKEGLPAGLRNRLLRLAAFQNPGFYQAQALRFSTYGTPRIVACAEDFPDARVLPPGTPAVTVTLPDADDPVVYAAHHGGCDTLLTFNVDDFPAAALNHLQPTLAVIHPDTVHYAHDEGGAGSRRAEAAVIDQERLLAPV
jgi:hypothetical protein